LQTKNFIYFGTLLANTEQRHRTSSHVGISQSFFVTYTIETQSQVTMIAIRNNQIIISRQAIDVN